MTRKRSHDNVTREMYAIWVGRIVAYGPHLLGRHEKPIVREQGVFVLVWMSAIICILGYISGYYHRDFWLFFSGTHCFGHVLVCPVESLHSPTGKRGLKNQIRGQKRGP